MATKKAPEPAPPSSPPGAVRRFLTWVGALGSQRKPGWVVATRIGVDPVLMRGVAFVGVALVLVAVLVVVVVAGLFALNPAPTATPTAAASASASPDPAANGPADSPCEELLDPAAVAAALGGSTEARLSTGDLVFAVVGGFECRYSFGESASEENGYRSADDSGSVSVIVAPSAIADPIALEASLTPSHCAPDPHMANWDTVCSATDAVDGWWYSLSAHTFTSEGALRTGFDAIREELDQALKAAIAPTQANVVQPFDCASVDPGSALGAGGRVVPEGSGEIGAAAYLLAGPTTCWFTTPDGERWALDVYPGGAVAYGPCTSSGAGSVIQVAGVKSAFALDDEFDHEEDEVCATDGKSTIRLSRYHAPDEALDSWNPTSLGELSSLLVPMFAAAIPSTTPFAPYLSAMSPNPVPPLVDGDCSALLDPPTLAAIAGGSPEAHVGSGDPLLAIAGGIGCSYVFGTEREGISGYVNVSVAPSVIAEPNELRASLTSEDCPTEPGCYSEATATVAGWWYSLLVSTDQSEEAQRASFITIREKLEDRLRDSRTPGQVGAAQPLDCGTANPGSQPWDRSRKLQTATGNPISAAAFLLVGAVTCEYTMPSGEQWDLTVYPGGASAYKQCIHRGEERTGPSGGLIAVENVETVYAHADYWDVVVACATDGESAVRVTRLDVDRSLEGGVWNEAARQTLSSVLVRVFAAAD